MKLLQTAHRVAQIADEAFERAILGQSNITARQAVVLAAINGNPEGSQTSIVETTGIDRSTLSDIVRRLETAGLTTRTRSPQDARAYQLSLTRKGRRELAAAITASDKAEIELRKRVGGIRAITIKAAA